MPDKTKLQVYKDLGVEIAKVCPTCRHSTFSRSDWGECALRTYQHEKHSGVRPMPVNTVFTCPSHSPKADIDMYSTATLGDYAYLLPYAPRKS